LPLKIRQRAGNPQNSVQCPGRQPEPLHSTRQKLFAVGLKTTGLVQSLARQRRIQAPPRTLPRPGLEHPFPDPGTAFARLAPAQQNLSRLHRYYHMQIEPVQQRPGDFVPIAHNLTGRALALDTRMATVTTRTRVPCGNHLESSRKCNLTSGTADGNFTGFHGLPKYLEYASLELRQLIQKQYASMGQGNLSGPGAATPANKSHSRCGMVWRPERRQAPATRLQWPTRH